MKKSDKIKAHFTKHKKYYKILLSNVLNGLCTSFAFILLVCFVVKFLGLDKSVIDEHIEYLSLCSSLVMFISISINELCDICKLCNEVKEEK